MFKNIVYGMCCTALLCEIVMFEEVMGMRQRSNSFSGIGHDEASTRRRSGSLPVTRDEIREAMEKYAYLVPADDEKTETVNAALRTAIIRVQLTENPEGQKSLVTLICNPVYNYSYANYVYMVFMTALQNCSSEVVAKLSRMLEAIAHSKSCSGGAHHSLFWRKYNEGYYDPPALPVEEDWGY